MLGSLKGLAKGIQIINEIIQECNTEMLVEVWVYKSVPFAFADIYFFGNGRKFYCVEVVLPWRG